jgi:hypothetical protein
LVHDLTPGEHCQDRSDKQDMMKTAFENRYDIEASHFPPSQSTAPGQGRALTGQPWRRTRTHFRADAMKSRALAPSPGGE